MAAALEIEGHHVRLAANGREALEITAAWIPEVIVSDMDMPLMSGSDLAARAKAAPALRYVPFFLMSALRAEPVASVYAFLHKPFPPSQLLGIIETASRYGVASNDSVGAEVTAEKRLDEIVEDGHLRVFAQSAVVAGRRSVRADRMQSELLHSILLSSFVAMRRHRDVVTEIRQEITRTRSAVSASRMLRERRTRDAASGRD